MNRCNLVALVGAAVTLLAVPASAGVLCPDTKAPGKTIVETAVEAGSFDTLAAALEAADLLEALSGPGPFTVFAPTDEAFARLPKGTLETLLRPESKALLTSILTYHVVSGDVRAAAVVKLPFATALNGQRLDVQVDEGTVLVAGAHVTKTDIACSNGVIHVIDAVLMPATKDIVTTAVEAGSFRTLAAALTAAGLVEALSGQGPFTVFAPTDEAFEKLPAGTLEHLLKPENKAELVAILKFHVVAGRIYSTDVAAGELATLAGKRLPISVVDGQPRIAGAALAQVDLETSNGVIHVVDAVLLPTR